MARPSVTVIAEATSRAASGVDFSPRLGALCPWCGSKSKIYKTNPWDGGTRIRYHQCLRSGCILAALKTTIKSIEVDNVTAEKY
jgi:hypothetical protein